MSILMVITFIHCTAVQERGGGGGGGGGTEKRPTQFLERKKNTRLIDHPNKRPWAKPKRPWTLIPMNTVYLE